MTVSAELPPGSKIDRYDIVGLLGLSERGHTYRARDPQLDRDVVIREYSPKGRAIRREGGNLITRSPEFERVLAFLEIGDSTYIVSEFVAGETLEVRAKREPLTALEIDALLWPLADGLQQVHTTGQAHGGINAAHILLSPNGRPTLIGFRGQDASETLEQQIRTDIRDLSCAAYFAITGRDVASGGPSLARLQPTGFSADILAAIEKGLETGFADVAEFKSALGERPASRTDFVSPRTAETEKMRRFSSSIAIAALCVCIMAIVGYFLAEPAHRLIKKTVPAKSLYDGRYIGILRLGTTALRHTEIVIVNGAGKSGSTNPRCGDITLVIDVSEFGYVTGRYLGYDANCGRSTFGVTGQIKDNNLSLVIRCDTCSDVLAGNVYRMDNPPTEFDGKWSVTHVCPPSGAVNGYRHRYEMIVKSGYAVAQWHAPGQPDSWTLAGQIRTDGSLEFIGVGRTGLPAFTVGGPPEGSPFSFEFMGRLQGRAGKVTDPGGRHCSLEFAKE